MLSFAVKQRTTKAPFMRSEIFSAFSFFYLFRQILGKYSSVDISVNKGSKSLCPYLQLLPRGCANSAVHGSQPFKPDNEIVGEVLKKKCGRRKAGVIYIGFAAKKNIVPMYSKVNLTAYGSMLRLLPLLCKPKSSTMTAGLSFWYYPPCKDCSGETRAWKNAGTFLNMRFVKYLAHCDWNYNRALLVGVSFIGDEIFLLYCLKSQQ